MAWGGTTFPLKGLWTHWSLCTLQVVGIIESHARAVDLMTHNYYELLYAFHVYRHNYRKGKAWDGTLYLPTHLGHPFPAPARCVASPGCWLMHFSLFSAGTVMFEYGMRLGREVRTLRGLQKQGNCFLAAINCLRLIRPEYAWIVQPASGAVVGMLSFLQRSFQNPF